MSRSELIRWGGLTAVLAGILRGVASFTSTPAGITSQVFYLIIDVLLLAGIVDLYAFQRKETGWWGFSGFLLALIGAVLLIGHDLVNALVILYPVAAFLFTVGLTILALCAWVAKTLPRWVAFFLIASTIVGLPGYLFKGLNILFLLAGIFFGIGFLGAGLTIWLQKSNPLITPSPTTKSEGLKV